MEKRPADKKWKYMNDTIKTRLKKNSLTNIIYFVVTLPIIFILTPIILQFVGKEVYGIWVITGTILIFLDLFGGSSSFSALGIIIPGYDPKKEPEEINKIVNTLFVFHLFTALFFAVLYLLAKDEIVSMFFKVDSALLSEVYFVLGVSVFLFLFNFVMLSFCYLLLGFNVLYPINIVHTVAAYARAAFMVWVLYAGYGIHGIVVVQMGTIILETITVLFIVKRVYPPLVFNPLMFSVKRLRIILTLSIKLFVTRAAQLVNYNADKLILGYFINPVMAAYYQIGAGITKYISLVPEMLGMNSLLAAAAELKKNRQQDKIYMLYDRVSKYIFFAGFLPACGIVIFGSEFIGLWLGTGYENVYLVMVFLAAGCLYGTAAYPAVNILNGLGRVNGPMIINSAAMAVNITLSIVLTVKYGLAGALSATVISIFLGTSAVCLLFFVSMKHLPRFDVIFLKPAVSAAAAFAVNAGLEGVLGQAGGWAVLILKITVFSAVYIAVSVFVLKHFDEKDKSLVKGIFAAKKEEKQSGSAEKKD
ncbi:MAG TPA: hypothetical protein ENN55_03325 [Firmicutes bacterium]|nr:hypothetical protein [Bacillota bacterium]